jgi:hypothetical protein
MAFQPIALLSNTLTEHYLSWGTDAVWYESGIPLKDRRTNTEPGADRGPRAGSPRGVVVGPGPSLAAVNIECTNQLVYRVNNLQVKVSISHRAPGRYGSRFRICVAFVEW